MSPQAARAALQLALFIIVTSAFTLLCQRPGSAEFVVTVLSLITGLLLFGAVVFVLRRFSK